MTFLKNELFCETRPESIHQTMIRTLKQLVGVRPWYTPHSAEKRPAQHRQAGSSQSWPCTLYKGRGRSRSGRQQTTWSLAGVTSQLVWWQMISWSLEASASVCKDVEILNTERNVWRPGPSLKEAKSALACIIVDNQHSEFKWVYAVYSWFDSKIIWD